VALSHEIVPCNQIPGVSMATAIEPEKYEVLDTIGMILRVHVLTIMSLVDDISRPRIVWYYQEGPKGFGRSCTETRGTLRVLY